MPQGQVHSLSRASSTRQRAAHPKFQAVYGPHGNGAALLVAVNGHCLHRRTKVLQMISEAVACMQCSSRGYSAVSQCG